MTNPISCVLVDVGGTLWPSGWAATEAVARLCEEQLAAVLPELAPRNAAFYRQLEQCRLEYVRMIGRDDPLAQDIDGVIRRAGDTFGLPMTSARLAAIRAALRVSPCGSLALFPGALELLTWIKERDLRCVAVSNAGWRGADAYHRDFADMGIGGYIDATVSSVDVGFRKPHPAMFDAALAAARCSAERCIMIGNSERNDVQPAVARGMRAILVAIEQPVPPASAAHAIVDSLNGATATLRDWLLAGQ